MKREILFRGKRVTGKWVTGYYYPDFDDTEVGYILSNDDGVVYDVWKIAVGQFTGLTDKNGVKIFEGDIVKDLNFEIASNSVVVYDPAIFRIANKNGDFVGDGYPDWDNFEVIGNIHDNPELLS